jgi:hypothetical protein
MDGPRFDAWTRLLARGIPRRRALKALAGVGVAGVGVRAVVHEAEACQGDNGSCEKRSECCDPLACVFSTCQTCIGLNDRCRSSEECCKDLTCNGHNNCTKGEGGARSDGTGCKKKHKKKHKKH